MKYIFRDVVCRRVLPSCMMMLLMTATALNTHASIRELKSDEDRIKKIPPAIAVEKRSKDKSKNSPQASAEDRKDSGISPKIVGGFDSEPGARPYQVSMQTVSEFHFCGAALIDSRWVLTAAHCIGGGYNVRLGGHDLSLADGQVIEVVQEVVYPGFAPAFLDSDLALLRLAEDAPEGLEYLQLPDGSVMDLVANPGDLLTVSGWGRLSSGGASPDILQQVDVPLVGNEECNTLYQNLGYSGDPITYVMICAGFLEGGKDSCQGDSGGPITATLDGSDYSIGIVSWGDDCAAANAPGVYTRTASFVDWINTTMASSLPVPTSLELDTPVNLSGAANEDQVFTFELTEDREEPFFVSLDTGDFGDADLLMYSGEALSTNICNGLNYGNDEICAFETLPAGSYKVIVRGYLEFANVNLLVSDNEPTLPNSITLENGVALTDLSGLSGEVFYYYLDVPVDNINLDVSIAGGTGDADLAIYDGYPFASNLLCEPFLFGNDELCELSSLSAGRYVISVSAFDTFEGLTLLASFLNPQLENGSTLTLDGLAGEEISFFLDIPVESSNLVFNLSGGSGDGDLYSRLGAEPTLKVYDYNSMEIGNEEEIVYASAPVGRYHLKVYAFEDFEGATLHVSYDEFVLAPATCEYKIVWDFWGRFKAAISITNESEEAIEGWQVDWEYGDGSRLKRRHAIWNAKLEGSNPYTASNLPWNTTIEPGETETFYVRGKNGADEPEIPKIMGEICR